MKQLAFLIISTTPFVRNIARISSHSFWLIQLLFTVSQYIDLILGVWSRKAAEKQVQSTLNVCATILYLNCMQKITIPRFVSSQIDAQGTLVTVVVLFPCIDLVTCSWISWLNHIKFNVGAFLPNGWINRNIVMGIFTSACRHRFQRDRWSTREILFFKCVAGRNKVSPFDEGMVM